MHSYLSVSNFTQCIHALGCTNSFFISVIQRSLRADDEDELFDQALSTNNVVNNQHSNPGGITNAEKCDS